MSKLEFTVRHAANPTAQEIEETTWAFHNSFGKAFFLTAMDGKPELSEDLCKEQVNAAIQDGELWIAELPEPNAEGKRIVGAATWYPPGKLMLRGAGHRDAPWEQSMSKLTEKNQQWWEVFYERFDAMNEKCLGENAKLNGWHLQLLGVHPDYQKKGISTAFDKAISEKALAAQPEGAILCLETVTGVPIYNKMGYEVKGDTMIPAPSGEGEIKFFTLMKKVAPA